MQNKPIFKHSSFSGLDISSNPEAIAAAGNLREVIHDSLGELRRLFFHTYTVFAPQNPSTTKDQQKHTNTSFLQ